MVRMAGARAARRRRSRSLVGIMSEGKEREGREGSGAREEGGGERPLTYQVNAALSPSFTIPEAIFLDKRHLHEISNVNNAKPLPVSH